MGEQFLHIGTKTLYISIGRAEFILAIASSSQRNHTIHHRFDESRADPADNLPTNHSVSFSSHSLDCLDNRFIVSHLFISTNHIRVQTLRLALCNKMDNHHPQGIHIYFWRPFFIKQNFFRVITNTFSFVHATPLFYHLVELASGSSNSHTHQLGLATSSLLVSQGHLLERKAHYGI